jgi:putative transposase
MKRNRFTDEQIISILKEHEAGTPVSELCRKHRVSDASIYKWKAKFGGMDVSEAKRPKRLFGFDGTTQPSLALPRVFPPKGMRARLRHRKR